MPYLAKTVVTCLVASLLIVLPAAAAPASSEGPVANASRTCSVTNIWRKLGASYVNKLSTRNVSCADARSFSRLYHRCRRRNGGADGRCPRINRFRCTERRYNRIDISYDANVLCVRGSQRIRQTYTQLT
jgi:hypothetical protein